MTPLELYELQLDLKRSYFIEDDCWYTAYTSLLTIDAWDNSFEFRQWLGYLNMRGGLLDFLNQLRIMGWDSKKWEARL